MARRNPEPPSGADKAKVRVFFAEVEGNNDSVQEALKTMVSAMSRPVRVISEPKVNGEAGTLLRRADAEEIDDPTPPANEEEVDALSEESNNRRPRGSGKKTDRNAGLELVPNLEFRPAGKQTLKAFVEERGAKSDVENVVAMIHYMQHTMGLSKIGPPHVMTAFKEVGKPIPVDLKATIRNIKKSKAFLAFTEIDDIRMTTQGDNFVEHDMVEVNSSG
jgi:hypothetical protein